MRGTRGVVQSVILVALALALAACGGSGNRLDSDNDGGAYLPDIQQVDSGWISLEVTDGTTITDGYFYTGGSDLVLADPYSGAAIQIYDENNVTTSEQIYDTDGNGLPNYIVVTIRALSAQAAASVTATDSSGSSIDSDEFIKIGGAAFLPLDAEFSNGVAITLPIYLYSGLVAGDSIDLFKFNDGTIDDRETASDVGTGTGVWEYVDTISVDSSGTTVTFDVDSLGQYCVATSSVEHTQGTTTDL